jgi:hypothetical protein
MTGSGAAKRPFTELQSHRLPLESLNALQCLSLARERRWGISGLRTDAILPLGARPSIYGTLQDAPGVVGTTAGGMSGDHLHC